MTQDEEMAMRTCREPLHGMMTPVLSWDYPPAVEPRGAHNGRRLIRWAAVPAVCGGERQNPNAHDSLEQVPDLAVMNSMAGPSVRTTGDSPGVLRQATEAGFGRSYASWPRTELN